MPQLREKTNSFHYVFGPVLSRRLGRSLGIDLVPFKTCTYDCIYCQLGRTTLKTVLRKEYVPLEAVLHELHQKITANTVFDYITLAGSGEPTLHSGIGRFIREARKLSEKPIAVITNGSLLWDAAVRNDLAAADVVIPSLDAASESTFSQVNRPHDAISFTRMLEGLIAFRSEFPNRIWLEILLVDGITSTESEVNALVQIVQKIKPDRVQLTTVTRPPAAGPARPVPRELLERFAAMFGENTEVLAAIPKHETTPVGTASKDDVLAVVQRHPCSLDDIAGSLGIPLEEATRHVETLLHDCLLTTYVLDGVVMFVPLRREPSDNTTKP